MGNKFADVLKGVRTQVVKHSPEILLGVGITGMVTTTVLAVRATPKALELLEDKKQELETNELPPVEVVKTTWKCYIPAVITGAASITCLIGANSVHLKRGAALAAAYNISTTALSEYKEKVIETIGEKKEQAVQEKVAEAQIQANPVRNHDVIVTTKGNTLCFDSYSGRWFTSDIDAIKKAETEVNRNIASYMYQSLNDFYDELGLDHSEIGRYVGWKLDDDMRRNPLRVQFSSKLNDESTPCLVISFNRAPEYDFDTFM